MLVKLPCEFGAQIDVEYLGKMYTGWFVGVSSSPSWNGGYDLYIQTNRRDITKWVRWTPEDVEKGIKIDLKGSVSRVVDIPLSDGSMSNINYLGFKGKSMKLINVKYELESGQYKYGFMDGSGRYVEVRDDLFIFERVERDKSINPVQMTLF